MNVVMIIVGAMVGGGLRYATEVALPTRTDHEVPRGTLMVNIVGSFILGIVIVVGAEPWRSFVGVGLCGALTTFSALSLQLDRLIEAHAWRSAALYALLTLVVGLGAAESGIRLGQWIN